jgi:Mg/Co/Ni transporter MgtE
VAVGGAGCGGGGGVVAAGVLLDRDPIAMALPWLLHRLGRDPAYGSGPLATVVQDLLSVLIFMGIAGALMH